MFHLLNKVISGIIIVLIVILLGLNQWVTISLEKVGKPIDLKIKWLSEIVLDKKKTDEPPYSINQTFIDYDPIDDEEHKEQQKFLTKLLKTIKIIYILFVVLLTLNILGIYLENPKYLFTLNILSLIFILAILFTSYFEIYKPNHNKNPFNTNEKITTTVIYSNSFWIYCSIYLLVLFQIGYTGYNILKK
jgi:hypothetical protein